MRPPSRVNEQFVTDQKTLRDILRDEPGQAGGLPELNDRVEAIEEVISLRIHNT